MESPSACPQCAQPSIRSIRVVGNIKPGPMPRNGTLHLVAGLALLAPMVLATLAMDDINRLSAGLQVIGLGMSIAGIWSMVAGFKMRKSFGQLVLDREMRSEMWEHGWTCDRCGRNWIPR